jgi:hypothetical protein
MGKCNAKAVRSGGWGGIKGSKGKTAVVGPAPFVGAARLEGDDEFSVGVRARVSVQPHD